MRSLLIVIKEEHLSKGIALALMDYFPTIHTTKNPYEAIELLKNEKIDVIITGLDFIIKDGSFSISEFNSATNIIIQQKPILIPNIIRLIQSLKENLTQTNNGE